MAQWIYTSSILIVAVLLIRAIGRDRLSARLRYALWGLVLLRLLMPFSIGESVLSVGNWLPETMPQAVMVGHRVHSDEGETVVIPHGVITGITDETTDTTLPSETSQTIQTNQTTQTNETTQRTEPVPMQVEQSVHVPMLIWCIGMVCVGGAFLVSNVRFWLRLRRSRGYLMTETVAVYESAAVETPCLFGFPRAAVYVTPAVASDNLALNHVLAHELTHHRHGDHIWSLLRCVCVTVHWYNPLVWLAAYLSQQDGELACDEGALLRLTAEERTAYARTLLDLTCVGYRGMLTTATSMTGSESDLKTRVLRIVQNPKMPKYGIPVVLVLAVVLALAVFTDAKTDELEGTWYAAEYQKSGNYPDWKEAVTTVVVFRDGQARMMVHRNGEPHYGRDYTYITKDGVLRLEYRDYDGVAGEFAYEWISENNIVLYSDSGLELGVMLRSDPQESVLIMDDLMEVSALEDLTHDTVMEANSGISHFKHLLMAHLRAAEILSQGSAGETVQYSEYCYRISVVEQGVAKDWLFADGWLHKDGVRYELSNGEDILALMREMVWQPVGGFTDENGRTYYHVRQAGVNLELRMEHDYRDWRYYPLANEKQWIAAFAEAKVHSVIGEAEHLQTGVDYPVLWLHDLMDGGYIVNVYPDGTMVYFEWIEDENGNKHSVEHYILPGDAPKMMELLEPYLQVYAASAAEAATQDRIYGIWNLVSDDSEQVTAITATMNTNLDSVYGEQDVWMAATVDGGIVETEFDIYLDDGLFHIRRRNGVEETVPYTLDEGVLTLYGEDGTWIFQHGETYPVPQETDLIRMNRKGSGRSVPLRLDLTDEKLAELEALLREGMVERDENIIFVDACSYYLNGLEEAFDTTEIIVTDFATMHFSGKAYTLTNWYKIQAFFDTLYRVEY